MRTDSMCPENILQEVLRAAAIGSEEGVSRADNLIEIYSEDPRLHFLKGSLLAALRKYADAAAAIGHALELAPHYAVARFQLGLLHLTNGDARLAQSTWELLLDLPIDNPLRLFVRGLERMIRDDFQEAIGLLRAGIAANTDIAPLNNDMRLIIKEMESLGRGEKREDDPVTATQILLQSFDRDVTRH